MVSTPSTRLSFEMQGQNDNTGSWWDNLNDGAIQLADDAIAKEVALATTGGDTVLSVTSYAADESRCPIIRIGNGQTLTSNARITTARARIYFATNETAAGSFSVKFGGTTSLNVTIPRGTGAYVRVRSDSTTTFAGPLITLSAGTIDAASLASGAFLLGTNNLSDLISASTARTNLGVAIGTNVQAWDAQLDSLSAASANGVSLATAADYAAMKVLLALTIGTNVQAYDADLTTWAALTPSANAQSLVTAADYAAMRTLLGIAVTRQRSYATYATNTALGTAIAWTDTAPTTSNGTLILSAAITPSSASNRVRIMVNTWGATTGVSKWAIAVFRGSTLVATKGCVVSASTTPLPCDLIVEDAPGTASSVTYSVYAGPDTGGTLYLNGTVNGRLFGGGSLATLVVEEIVP